MERLCRQCPFWYERHKRPMERMAMSYEPKRADFSLPVRINLYSDTQTRPSRAMKEAMMAPKRATSRAVRTPRCGSCATGRRRCWARRRRCSCRPAPCATRSRSPRTAGPATKSWRTRMRTSSPARPADRRAISGVMIRGLPGERGIFSADTLRSAIRPVSRYAPPQRLVEVEQTANKGGGTCWQVAGAEGGGGCRARARHESPHGRRAPAECRGGAGRGGQ